MRSYVAACYFGLDETNRCHGNECDVPRNMLFFSLLHNSWYLQEQEAILQQGEGSETPYMTFFKLLFRGSDFVSFVKVILRRGLRIL
jgi:hypothetical protein